MPGPRAKGDAFSQTYRVPSPDGSSLREPLDLAAAAASELTAGAELVGSGLQGVRNILRELVRTPVSFLLVGPTGGGKDQFARAFHQSSSRADKPFYVLNCAAIPDSLFETQLFGCRKGAFTGADSDRIGILEAAQGGFVLLNEINDSPLTVQAKLLQAIDDKLIWRVGESQPRKIDVWFAAATNRTDLIEMCDRGRFREDLYHRLAQVVVRLPLLRDRAADISELLDYLTTRVARELGRHPIAFDADAMKAMMQYGWPGNVRELGNLVKTLTIMSEGGTIGIDMIPEGMRKGLLGGRFMRVTRDALRRKLIDHRWNVTNTARMIGVSREYVHALMRKYKLVRPANIRTQSHGVHQDARSM